MNILLIDDDQQVGETVCRLIEGENHHAQPALSGQAGLALLNETKFDAILLDMNLGSESGLDVLQKITREHVNLPVVMFTEEGTVARAVEAMRLGAVDFLEKPFAPAELHAAITRLQRLKSTKENTKRLEPEAPKTQPRKSDLLLDFASPSMGHVKYILVRAAKSSATILITGESGTGKSVLAQAIHNQSHLAGKPFVTVSCPSLSKDLLESELFGHAKGAFTGAHSDHWGKVKAAAGGTLFLDEIGDLPMEIQPKLLRLLQEQQYERLGENITHPAHVRVIAATNRDLKKQIAEGAFREDLYFRLNVIAVEMPPLRARNNDLIRFANHYLQYFAEDCGRKMPAFSQKTVSLMEDHSWPGNLRELRNVVQRAVILATTDQIDSGDLNLELQRRGDADLSSQPGDLISLKELEELHVRRVINRTGSIAESAKVLGIDPATIYRRRKEWISNDNKARILELVC